MADTFHFGNLRLTGWSRAGIETWFRVHPPGLALDVGRGALQLAGAGDLFVSHGHLDHALGVPYVLSQRTLHHGASTRVFCPRETAAPLAALIEAAARLEQVSYDYELVGLEPGDRVEVGRDLAVEAFPTDHVVPSLGFHLEQTRRRLRPELRGLPGTEIARRKAAGESIETEERRIVLSYCGDTGPGVFELDPRLFTSSVLVLECTFLDEDHREHGSRYKHVHFDDLVVRADRFANDHLVLHHLSRRYTAERLREEVERRLPALAGRIHLMEESRAVPA